MGDGLFKGRKRVAINSKKVRKNLALRCGIPMEQNGSIDVVFDDEFLQYGKKKIGAYYSTVEQFGQAVIIKLVMDTDGVSFIAETFLNESKRWQTKEQEICGDDINRSDLPLSKWLDYHQQITEAIELEEAKGAT